MIKGLMLALAAAKSLSERARVIHRIYLAGIEASAVDFAGFRKDAEQIDLVALAQSRERGR